jgi:hypothetical protein
MLIYLTLDELSQCKCKNRKNIDLICLKAQSHISALMFLCLCLLFLFCCRHHSPLFILHHSSFTRFHQKPADHRNSLCPIKTITLSSLTGVLYCPLNNAQFKCSELLFSTIVTNYFSRYIYSLLPLTGFKPTTLG